MIAQLQRYNHSGLILASAFLKAADFYLWRMHCLEEYHTRGVLEAGCDEAGRGCLAGPVVAAAVILPEGWNHDLLNDSKKVSEGNRNILKKAIEAEATSWAVGWVWPDEIDCINILNASFLAMHRAIDKLTCRPLHLIIDGNRFNPYQGIPHHCIVKGDSKYRAIAAASVLAKTHRDAYMAEMHALHVQYNWQQNKGYPTKVHREAIALHGASPLHRMTFALLPQPTEIFQDS